MSFTDPIVGGTVLRIPAEQSPNFSMSAQTGWAILQNGDAYFFNITATGDITATQFDGTDFTIDSAGIFFYDGTPTSGNLLISIAGIAGSDTYGNSYAQGFTIGESGSDQIVMGLTGGSPLIFFPTGGTDITNSSAIQTIREGTGNAGYDQIQILGAENTTNTDTVLSTWLSSSEDGTQYAQIQDYYHDTSGTYHQFRTLSYDGCTIGAGSVTAVQPGTGTSRTNVAAPETWHTASLATDFTTSAADQAPRYRLEPIAGGQIRLDGVVYTSASVTSGTTMFTLPAGYRPAERKRFTGVTNGTLSAGATLVEVATSGAVTVQIALGAANDQVVLDGITFPVD